MKKENILFAIIGLLIGGIIGFSLANNLNRSAGIQPTNEITQTQPEPNPNLPPDHPPFVPQGEQTSGAPVPQVTEAIEKAKNNPNDYEAQMTAADLYYQIQRFDEAAEFYEQANKLNPEEIEPIVRLGNAKFDAEKFGEAEQWYARALDKDPKNTNVRTDYALTFFLRTPRDTERAIKEHKITLSIDPNHELTLQNLAIAYNEQKDTKNLQKTIEKLKTINPDNPAVKQFSVASNQ